MAGIVARDPARLAQSAQAAGVARTFVDLAEAIDAIRRSATNGGRPVTLDGSPAVNAGRDGAGQDLT